MSDLIDTTEMYLRTVFELIEEGVVPMRARIAERLGQSGPTVSQTVARMERDGLVRLEQDRHLELTSAGLAKATEVMRRHRLAERLLLDVIGLDWPLVHQEACRWEHVMSTDVELKLMDLLGGPTRSPYGNPIPGLGALGGHEVSVESFRNGVQPLSAHESGGTFVVRRLGENIQGDPAELTALWEAGVRAGASIDVTPVADDQLKIIGTGTTDKAVLVCRERAAHIFVEHA
ncbi:MAG: dihydrofolate reductase [Micrococcales bacterium]|nr:MAG: dihydrofolate reductase [Micrococcales bacterium]